MSSRAVPVVTVCSTDLVLRSSATAGLLCDVPEAFVLQHDLDPPGPDGGATLTRTVFGAGAVAEREQVHLEHGCLSCAIREDVLPALDRLAALRPPLVVLALPVGSEPLPVVRAVQHAGPALRAAAVVTVLDDATFEDDLLGDETLAERGLALHADDGRALGEVIAHQVEYSDAVLTPDPPDAAGARLLAHLATPPWRLEQVALHEVAVRRLAATIRPFRDVRGDLQAVVPSGVADGDGVWTLDLASERPVHPDRLLARIEDLGTGRLRARGHLWLPTRPQTACAWDGAGGQLSIGSLGPWRVPRASTRLVVTGTEPDERRRVADAFADVLLTADEAARGPLWWSRRGDDLEPWLGDPAAA